MRAAILLAAGGSRRFGRGDKLLAMLGGRPLLLHALDGARGAARRVIVVVPSLGGRIGRSVPEGQGVHRVVARRHRDGLAASLAAGLAQVRPCEREVLVFLGDMPFARAGARWRVPPGADGLRPWHDGVPGHPILIRTAAARAARVAGDRGLAGRSGRIERVAGSMPDVLDIDTRAALVRLRRIAAGGMRVGVRHR